MFAGTNASEDSAIAARSACDVVFLIFMLIRTIVIQDFKSDVQTNKGGRKQANLVIEVAMIVIIVNVMRVKSYACCWIDAT